MLVGYNRRFSPLSRLLKENLRGGRFMLTYRVNAGTVPANHWHQDPEEGGGRIVGEACHFIDVLQYMTDALPVSVTAAATAEDDHLPADPDTVAVTITFSDGSVGTLIYTSTGDPNFPKERLEVFGGGMAGVIDNWRSMIVRGNGRKITKTFHLQAEKGHAQELEAFVRAVRSGEPAISIHSQIITNCATFAIQEAVRTGSAVAAWRVTRRPEGRRTKRLLLWSTSE